MAAETANAAPVRARKNGAKTTIAGVLVIPIAAAAAVSPVGATSQAQRTATFEAISVLLATSRTLSFAFSWFWEIHCTPSFSRRVSQTIHAGTSSKAATTAMPSVATARRGLELMSGFMLWRGSSGFCGLTFFSRQADKAGMTVRTVIFPGFVPSRKQETH